MKIKKLFTIGLATILLGMASISYAATTTISGQVYIEGAANKTYDGNLVDADLAGVILRLSCTNGSGSPINSTTGTTQDGSYTFSGVPVGQSCTLRQYQASYGLYYANAYISPGAGGTGTDVAGSSTDSIITFASVPATGSINNNFAEQSVDIAVNFTPLPNLAPKVGDTVNVTTTCKSSILADVFFPTCGLTVSGVAATPVCPSTVSFLEKGKTLNCTVSFKMPANKVTLTASTNAKNDPQNYNNQNIITLTPAPTTTTISGRVYLESNGNKIDNGHAIDQGLKATALRITCANGFNAPAQTTNDGSYTFTGVPIGQNCTITEYQPINFYNDYVTPSTGAAGSEVAGTATGSTITFASVPATGSSGNNFAEQSTDMAVTFFYHESSFEAWVGEKYRITTVCQNTILADALSPTCGLTVSGVVATPVCPSAVSLLEKGKALECTILFTMPANKVTLTASTGASNDANTNNNTSTIALTPKATISGRVYYERTNDKTYRRDMDSIIANIPVQIQCRNGIDKITNTSDTGYYSFTVPAEQACTIRLNGDLASYPNAYITPGDGAKVVNNELHFASVSVAESNHNNFAKQGANLEAKFTPAPNLFPKPGDRVNINTTCKNIGTVAAEAPDCSISLYAVDEERTPNTINGVKITPTCTKAPRLEVGQTLTCTLSFTMPAKPVRLWADLDAYNGINNWSGSSLWLTTPTSSISGRVYFEKTGNKVDDGHMLDTGIALHATSINLRCASFSESRFNYTTPLLGDYTFTGVPIGDNCYIAEFSSFYPKAYIGLGENATLDGSGIKITSVPAAGSKGNNFAKQSTDMAVSFTPMPNPSPKVGDQIAITTTCKNIGATSAYSPSCDLFIRGSTTTSTCTSAYGELKAAQTLTCKLSFTMPATPVLLTASTGAHSDANANNNYSTVTLTPATTTISGRVYIEGNGNKVDNGHAIDKGLGGMPLSLTCGAGLIKADTTTNSTGNYVFTGVPVGQACTITDRSNLFYAYITPAPGAISWQDEAEDIGNGQIYFASVPIAGSTDNNFAKQSTDMAVSFTPAPSLTPKVGDTIKIATTCKNTVQTTAHWAACGLTITGVTATPICQSADRLEPAQTLTCTLSFTMPTTPVTLTASTNASNDVNVSNNKSVVVLTPPACAPTVSIVAGKLGVTGQLDGVSSGATFNYPSAVVQDNAGNIYVLDAYGFGPIQPYRSSTVRKITPAGIVSTLAGDMTAPSGSTDSPMGKLARFGYISYNALAIDKTKNILYFADDHNNIREINLLTGTVSTLATLQAPAWGLTSIALDYNGNLYTSSQGRIYKIDTSKNPAVVSLLTGESLATTPVDGPLASAKFRSISGMAFVKNNLIVYDLYISKEPTKAWLRRVDLNSGKVTTLAGGVNGSPPQDGLFSTVNFNGFWMGMTVDATDNIYLTDQSYLRKISNVFDASKGNITTIVNAPNLQTNAHSLYSPFYGVDSTGNPVVYFTDAYNKTIRKLSCLK